MQRAGFSAVAVAVAVVLLSSCQSADVPLGPVESLVATRKTDDLARIDLGTLGGASSHAVDVNNSDVVVGWSTTAAGDVHAFRWTQPNGMTDLGTLPGHSESQAIAILDFETRDGSLILGTSRAAGQSDWTPVVWSGSGAIRALPIPLLARYEFGQPTDFNVGGEVVGWDAAGFGQHGWTWSAASPKVDLSEGAISGTNEGIASGITDNGLVVLTTTAPSTCGFPVSQCWRTFLWSSRSGFAPLGTPDNAVQVDVMANGLSDGGVVAGVYQIPGAPLTPYRWSVGGGFTPLPRLSTGPIIDGYATAVNDANHVVGAEYDATVGFMVAALWPADGGVRRLDGDAPNHGIAEAINKRGTIAGTSADHAVIWTRARGRVTSSDLVASSATRSLGAPRNSCLSGSRVVWTRASRMECLIRAERGR